jgi:hypothetical protein
MGHPQPSHPSPNDAEGWSTRPVTHRPLVVSRQLSAVSHQPFVIGRQSSAVSHQPSVISRSLLAASHQPSVISRQLSAVSYRPVSRQPLGISLNPYPFLLLYSSKAARYWSMFCFER